MWDSSDLFEVASSDQEDESVEDGDRILADLAGGNITQEEHSSVQADVLGSTHSGPGEGNPTSTRWRRGHLQEISSVLQCLVASVLWLS